MKITVNTEALRSEGLSLGEFLVLLIGFYDIPYKECLDNLVAKGIIQPNLFTPMSMVLSNNTKNLVSQVLLQSDDRVLCSGINFFSLAQRLQALFPSGSKPGTSYSWRGSTNEVAQKLRTLFVCYDFSFTEEEALAATKEYVSSFTDTAHMQLLKYFILHTNPGDPHDFSSLFMTVIENNRQ